jgi:hypothetical protein
MVELLPVFKASSLQSHFLYLYLTQIISSENFIYFKSDFKKTNYSNVIITAYQRTRGLRRPFSPT